MVADIDIGGSFPIVRSDFTDPMVEIKDLMVESVQRNFTEGGRPNKWPALKSGGERRLIGKSGRLYQGVARGASSGKDYAEIDMGRSGLPYAGIQHFGGVTHPRVTEQSKRFYLAKYIETREIMWLALLNDKKHPIGSTLTITIPPAPYLMFQQEDGKKAAQILGMSLFETHQPTRRTDAN